MTGERDRQTVISGGARSARPGIDGVKIIDLGNVITRSGWMTEVFRADWPGVTISPKQVNWVELSPNGVTDWHRHARQIDHLVGVGGVIKLALWDGAGKTDVIRFGAIRPLMIVVPPGTWHALRNESGHPAGYLNFTDQLYDYENPDNWRLTQGESGVPDIL